MNTTNHLALVLALALGATTTACSTSDPASPADDDGDGSGSGSGGNSQSKPLDATGTYTMHSTFDLATNAPGTAGAVVNTIIAATDGSDDPTRWIVDQLLAQLPDGAVKKTLQGAEGFVVGYLNQKLLDIAPDFVPTMLQVGNDFGDIARHFGLNETLAVTGSGASYTAVHTVVGAHFKLGSQEGDFTLANYHVDNIVVSDVGVTMDPTGQLAIAAHDLPLAYGKLLRLGLDAAIVPLIDPSAHNLNELLAHQVDCQRVGQAVADAINQLAGFPIASASTVAAACTTGLATGANFVYAKIDAIDGNALDFSINGTARAVDNDNDRRIDAIQTGAWAGTLAYGTSPTPLLPATFFGERM